MDIPQPLERPWVGLGLLKQGWRVIQTQSTAPGSWDPWEEMLDPRIPVSGCPNPELLQWAVPIPEMPVRKYPIPELLPGAVPIPEIPVRECMRSL